MSRQFTTRLGSYARFVPVIFVFLLVSVLILLADIDKKLFLMRLVEKAPFGDKMAHFFLFGLLAATLNSALRYRRLRCSLGSLQIGGLLVLGFAWLEEFSQMALVSRTFDVQDMVADLLGVLIAQLFARRQAASWQEK